MVKGLVRLGLVLGLLPALAGAVGAQTRPQAVRTEPKSFLLVGNSFFYYNNGMGSVFSNFAKAADEAEAARYRVTMATISGSGLNWHDVDAYLRPGGGMASYSFVGDNEVVFNTFDKPFDVVVMNDCSQCPIHPKLSGLFHDYARRHSDTVRARGAIPVLFMTWAYADRPEMTGPLAEAYVKAGRDNGVMVVPAGLAFARALARQPTLALHAADKRHPSPAGTYLAAATLYASIFRRSPEGLAVAMPGVDPGTAGLLRQVAWETVQEFDAAP